jgi:restriction endonuclease Mrr
MAGARMSSPDASDPVWNMVRAFAQVAQQIEAAWASVATWEEDELTDAIATVGYQLEDLHQLSPAAFERWVGDRFSERGYQVQRVGTHGTGGDHGIDLAVAKPGERAVVQCRNYRAWKVGEPTIRDLFGVLHAAKADKAYLITTGRVTQAA